MLRSLLFSNRAPRSDDVCSILHAFALHFTFFFFLSFTRTRARIESSAAASERSFYNRHFFGFTICGSLRTALSLSCCGIDVVAIKTWWWWWCEVDEAGRQWREIFMLCESLLTLEMDVKSDQNFFSIIFMPFMMIRMHTAYMQTSTHTPHLQIPRSPWKMFHPNFNFISCLRQQPTEEKKEHFDLRALLAVELQSPSKHTSSLCRNCACALKSCSSVCVCGVYMTFFSVTALACGRASNVLRASFSYQ
jgi:hypothetical protein